MGPGESPMPAPPARAAPRGLAGLVGKGRGGATPYEILDTASSAPNVVLLNVYDIGDMEIMQDINRVSTMNDSVLIGGVYHAGVEVYGREWGYGFTEDDDTGVCYVEPRCNFQHTYRATVEMGVTKLGEQEVDEVLERLMAQWPGADYDLIHHNCLDFATMFCEELGVGRIPGWVDRFGRTGKAVHRLSKKAAVGVRQTRQLAKSVSTDVGQTLRGISSEVEEVGRWTLNNARREVARIAGAAQPQAQAISMGFARWSQELVGATARALGDDPASRERRRRERKGQDLRASLRNRGGVSLENRADQVAHSKKKNKSRLTPVLESPEEAARAFPTSTNDSGSTSLADDAFLLGGPLVTKAPLLPAAS